MAQPHSHWPTMRDFERQLAMTQSDQLFMGIDGGGTNCRARLRDTHGTLLGEASSGPANSRLGVKQAQDQVLRVALTALENAGRSAEDAGQLHVGAGLAGLHLDKDRNAFLDWSHPFATLKASNDAHIAYLGAHEGAMDAGILILGTGSCGYGMTETGSINIGGWGFLLSDDASGAQTGYRAVRYALSALDGINQASPLTDAILDRFGNRHEDIVLWGADAKPTDFGAFARLVVEHANQDDPIARQLMRECGNQASAILRALAKRGITKVALMGGFAEFVEPWLTIEATALLVPRKFDARDGAILMAGGTLPDRPESFEHSVGHGSAAEGGLSTNG